MKSGNDPEGGEPSSQAVAAMKDRHKVLVGSDGWLYLQNDGNMSVEQYTGKISLTQDAILRWEQYFEAINALKDSLGFKFVQLFAPSKESVYDAFYPYSDQKAAVRPIDTVLALAGTTPVCYPCRELRPENVGRDTYDRGDSHWNALGAAVAGAVALEQLGRVVADPLSHEYYERIRSGDLESKLPEIATTAQLFPRYSAAAKTVFDSQVENRGRIIVMNNAEAPEGSLVIFGDSFGNRVQLMLRDSFRRIVYVHGHSIDEKLLQIEKPDYVIAEMVERFVVNAPSNPKNFSILDSIREKLPAYSEERRLKIKRDYLDAAATGETALVDYLIQAFDA